MVATQEDKRWRFIWRITYSRLKMKICCYSKDERWVIYYVEGLGKGVGWEFRVGNLSGTLKDQDFAKNLPWL